MGGAGALVVWAKQLGRPRGGVAGCNKYGKEEYKKSNQHYFLTLNFVFLKIAEYIYIIY
jgi:hypothetical protein